MKIKPQKPYYNIDPVSKQIVGDAIFDGYRDESDSFCSRFGLTQFADTATGFPGDGLFYWDKMDMLLAVSGGSIFQVNEFGVCTALTGEDLETGTPTVFAPGQKIDNSAALYLCNGGKLNYTTNGTTFSQAASPAPQTATHVVYGGLRWLANEYGTARFSFSDIDPSTGEFDPTYWDAVENPLTADARGDNILGIYQAWDDFAVWGSDGRELWQTTGGAPPLESRLGAFCEAGLLAPYSVQKADNTLYALCVVDNKPAVIRLQGNDPVIISLDIEKVLDTLTTFSDAIGDLVSVGGQSFYILTFPTENQTWVYNVKKQEWYQWSQWSQEFVERRAFLGRHFIYVKPWGIHLCQSRVDGKIYRVDVNGTADGPDLIRAEYQSGWMDGGTSNRKILTSLRFHLKRAQGSEAGSEPVIMFCYRDDGNMEWKNERQISLGLQGQYEIYRTIRALGMFRSRQISVVITDPAKLVLVEMDAELKILRN